MITSHIIMPIFRRDSILQSLEDCYTLTEVACYDFDLGLDVGELIKINNFTKLFLDFDDYVEVRVKSKSKVLKEERVSVNDVKYSVRIEYFVEFLNQPDEKIPLNGKEKSFISSDSDLFLIELVELAEKENISTHVTLFLQGTVISGYLISESSYFSSMRRCIRDNVSIYPTLESAEKFLDTFRYFKNKYDRSRFQERKEVIDREFIYLSCPNIYLGNSVMRADWGDPWRGRLSRIDGFLIGNSKNDKLHELEDWQKDLEKSWNEED